jgi:hypothetical protein
MHELFRPLWGRLSVGYEGPA